MSLCARFVREALRRSSSTTVAWPATGPGGFARGARLDEAQRAPPVLLGHRLGASSQPGNPRRRRARASISWPKSPRRLSTALRRIGPQLRMAGMIVEFDRSRERSVTITGARRRSIRALLTRQSGHSAGNLRRYRRYRRYFPHLDGASRFGDGMTLRSGSANVSRCR